MSKHSPKPRQPRKTYLGPEMRQLIGGIHHSTLYRWVKEGKFPAPVILPSGKKAWIASEIDTWLDSLPRG